MTVAAVLETGCDHRIRIAFAHVDDCEVAKEIDQRATALVEISVSLKGLYIQRVNGLKARPKIIGLTGYFIISSHIYRRVRLQLR